MGKNKKNTTGPGTGLLASSASRAGYGALNATAPEEGAVSSAELGVLSADQASYTPSEKLSQLSSEAVGELFSEQLIRFRKERFFRSGEPIVEGVAIRELWAVQLPHYIELDETLEYFINSRNVSWDEPVTDLLIDFGDFRVRVLTEGYYLVAEMMDWLDKGYSKLKLPKGQAVKCGEVINAAYSLYSQVIRLMYTIDEEDPKGRFISLETKRQRLAAERDAWMVEHDSKISDIRGIYRQLHGLYSEQAELTFDLSEIPKVRAIQTFQLKELEKKISEGRDSADELNVQISDLYSKIMSACKSQGALFMLFDWLDYLKLKLKLKGRSERGATERSADRVKCNYLCQISRCFPANRRHRIQLFEMLGDGFKESIETDLIPVIERKIQQVFSDCLFVPDVRLIALQNYFSEKKMGAGKTDVPHPVQTLTKKCSWKVIRGLLPAALVSDSTNYQKIIDSLAPCYTTRWGIYDYGSSVPWKMLYGLESSNERISYDVYAFGGSSKLSRRVYDYISRKVADNPHFFFLNSLRGRGIDFICTQDTVHRVGEGAGVIWLPEAELQARAEKSPPSTAEVRGERLSAEGAVTDTQESLAPPQCGTERIDSRFSRVSRAAASLWGGLSRARRRLARGQRVHPGDAESRELEYLLSDFGAAAGTVGFCHGIQETEFA